MGIGVEDWCDIQGAGGEQFFTFLVGSAGQSFDQMQRCFRASMVISGDIGTDKQGRALVGGELASTGDLNYIQGTATGAFAYLFDFDALRIFFLRWR